MENIQTGLLLMLVGMTTVFIILLIVIYLGKVLIALVNRYAPEEIIIKKQAPVVASAAVAIAVAPAVAPALHAGAVLNAGLSDRETVAIISAVSMATRGKGKVVKIEKQITK
ncbi:MAG: OadG family protein [Tannerellaceae bacterium]|jgi:oxaloacetate decarboxylase gamma subunit|nr:OadG family protein [Tannerellaceae bacterium]